MPGCKNLVGRWTKWQVGRHIGESGHKAKNTFAHSTVTASWSALMLILICIHPATCCSHGFIRWKRGQISNCNRSRLNLYSWGEYLFILVYMNQTKTPWAILVKTCSARSNKKCHCINLMHNNVITVCPQDWYVFFGEITTGNCQSPDFKSPLGATKNLERLYNQVVDRSLLATLVITASSHSKWCPADQTIPDQMINMINMIKMIKMMKMIQMMKMMKMIMMIKIIKMIKHRTPASL